MTYTTIAGQSWFDVCLMTYGDLSFLLMLFSDNNQNIENINANPIPGTIINFNAVFIFDNSIFDFINSKNINYITGISGQPLLSDAGQILYSDQGFILYADQT